MQSTSSASKVSFAKNPRKGQQEVINAVVALQRGDLNCQLPTGYGKTFTALASYAELRRLNVVDRLLYIVPRTSQLNQFLEDAKDNCRDVGLKDLKRVRDVGYAPPPALKDHRNNKCQLFACTIQALATSGKTWIGVQDLLQSGRWMIVIDEYHHYGNEAVWGQKAASLPCVFRLAMSATPYRVGRDSAFGEPGIRVAYRAALKENAVKKLLCHSYVYRVDVEMEDGTIRSMTTEDIVNEAGSDEPNEIQKMSVDRKMRWLPKYVSPLVEIPINRALDGRLQSGVPQQVLITAMCCSHARLVCEQVCAMFPDLRIDWVGTGDYGRPDKENDAILAKFCPPKREGSRNPADIKLDVLVHVGIAGEGLDSVYVTEVIHLTTAKINNSTNQKNGRAARVIPGLGERFQVAYINVDSSSEYAGYQGESVMDLMDDLDIPKSDDDDDDTDRVYDPDKSDIPLDPTLNGPRIVDVECVRIDEGDLQRYAQAWALTQKAMPEHEYQKFLEAEGVVGLPFRAALETSYRNMKAREAREFNAKADNGALREYVERARSIVVGMCMKRLKASSAERTNSTLAGLMKKALNRHAMRMHGPCDENASNERLLAHQRFYHDLKEDILINGVPNWLMVELPCELWQ